MEVMSGCLQFQNFSHSNSLFTPLLDNERWGKSRFNPALFYRNITFELHDKQTTNFILLDFMDLVFVVGRSTVLHPVDVTGKADG